MCGRFVIFDEAEDMEIRSIIDEINKKYKDDDGAKFKSGEIFPTNTVPVITKENNGRDISLFKWGFPNFKNPGVIINARSETLQEKST